MRLFGIPVFPEQASTFAMDVDALYFFLVAVSSFFALLIAVLVIAWPAAASEPSAAPPSGTPDPEFLEFLGETAGMDPEVVKFMESREAKRAVKDAAAKEPDEEDEDDE